jgi:hypothetical protein
MKRNHWLALAILLLLAGNIVWYVWVHWGLITVHSKDQTLGTVIRSIEKQGHVTIRTNLDLTKPVQMDVVNVALAEALETLATVTDSRWRLAYYVGPDQGSIGGALAAITTGKRPEGWKTLYVPVPGFGGDEEAILPDPRRDPWEVKPAQESTLQAYLQQASRNVSASFLVPENWNPPVKSPPKAGPIGKALPRLVSAANGKYEEVFLLQGDPRERAENDRGRDRRGAGGDDDGPRFAGNFGGGGPPGGGRGGFDREAMEERIQNEINKLPAAERATAQAEHDERKKFFEDMKDLTPEQREARMQDFMNDPKNQDRMENAMNARDARRSPQQRAQRAQKYLQRKAAATKAAAAKQ